MRRALLVIDMQNDYLGPGRRGRFSYDTDSLVRAVNDLIEGYAEEGQDVLYIRHIVQNLPTNRLLFGYSLAGTEGAELYGGLAVVSDLCFDKLVGDALTNRRLREHLERARYDGIGLCGLDACGCVKATALGAARRGYDVVVHAVATATVASEDKLMRVRAQLLRAGVRII